MELKSLILGLVLTIGLFALKSGVGLHYFLNQQKKTSLRCLFFAVYSAVYFLIFMVSSHILHSTSMIQHFDTVQSVLKSGMTLHMLMAALLLVWGILLLKKKKERTEASYGWLALAIPCPVCVISIFFSTGFLISFFPDLGHWPVLWMYKGFILISFLTVLVMGLWARKSDISPESVLGGSMLFIAAYFFLSVFLMPQFSDLDKIYRLARYKSDEGGLQWASVSQLCLFVTTAFLFGFFTRINKIRRIQQWTSEQF